MSEPISLIRLADVAPERVSWLWPGYIPLGKLVTLDGDPGLGKSTLAMDIGATVTTGTLWPDETRCEHPGDVLIMSAEDGLADTVRPRADAARAKVGKIHAIQGVPIIDEDGTAVLRPPTLADVAALDHAITSTSARLLVIDVLMAYLPSGTDAHKDQDIRRVLSRLSELADRTRCTILLLRHLNKGAGRDPLYRGGGSIGIVGAARAGLLVASDPDDPQRRVLAAVKSNLGAAPEALAYRLVDSPDHGCARVRWEGKSGHTAHSLLKEPPSDDERDAHTEAERWLSDYLRDRSATSQSVKKSAAKDGIKERTLQRAVKTVAEVKSVGFPRTTWWTLRSRANAAKTPPDAQNLGATGATGADQRKQNGATVAIPQSRQPPCDGATGQPSPATPAAMPLKLNRPRCREKRDRERTHGKYRTAQQTPERDEAAS